MYLFVNAWRTHPPVLSSCTAIGLQSTKVFILFLMSFMLMASSWAAPSTKELAKAAFQRGRVAFEAEKYPEALKAFEEAYQHFPLPLMLYNIANVYENLKLYPRAIEKYRAFIKTGKDTDGEAEKKLIALEEQVKDWIDVSFTSDPSGSEIRLYYETYPILGATPLRLRVPPREDLAVFISTIGGTPIKKYVAVLPNQKRQTIHLTMPKQVAYVRVLGEPKQTQVKSGTETALSLPGLLKLSVGDHELSFSAPGYLPIKRVVSLRAVHTDQAPLTIEVQLMKSEGVGLLALDVNEEGALLFIDGVPRGQSPFNDPIELSEGDHLIEVKGSKGGQFQKSIKLGSGEMVEVAVNFDQPSTWLTRERITLGLVGLGSASLLTGLVLGAVALNAQGNLEDCRAHELCARRQGELDRAQALRAYSFSADLFTLLGLAIGGTGGVMLWLDHQAQSPTVEPSVQVGAVPGGAKIHAQFRF